MPINKGEEFSKRDVFIDYPYEEVMFRWDHLNEKCYKKFYGKVESNILVESSNHLFNEALRFGDEITKIKYMEGKSV